MDGDGSSLRRDVWLTAGALLLAGFAGPGPLWAQQVEDQAASRSDERDVAHEETHAEGHSEDPAAHIHEEVVVVGSRARQRSLTESMVPVDVISAEHVAHQGETNLDMLLRNVVPSFNISATTGDALVVVRPINLRGLAPDHTLVLVNGRRRHRGAVIVWTQIGVSHGAQGPDISSIPAIALRQVEVLRDGAAAQYGSDAIAGVVNFQLKDARSGGSFELLTGAYGKGDGESVTFAGNVGLPWGEAGFVNLSVEVGGARPTDRSIQRSDAAALIAAGNLDVSDPAQVYGAPRVEDDLKLWVNFGRPAGRAAQVYGHANYASRRIGGRNFFFRNPNTRAAVYSADGGRTLLVGDALDARDGVVDGSAGCPAVSITDHVPDPSALARVFRDPNCFTFQELYPGGFQPAFGGDRTDASLASGVRGATSGGTIWDMSLSAGRNEADFYLIDSVNASLGPDSPTTFDPGLYGQEEFSANVDLARQVGERLHAAAGLEWRSERFEIGLGDPASWTIGPYAAQGFSAGSNGFPGFSPITAGEWSRANAAVYTDFEYGPPDHSWTVGAALRFEDYEDFGSTWNGKLAGRLQVRPSLGLRGSVSTGFRAPTPGQQNAFNVSTQWDAKLLELVNNGTIPSTSRVAELRGGRALDAEKSLGAALGLVLDRGPVTVTVDAFRIDLRDRLGVTRLFSLEPVEVEQLLAEGITSARNLANFRFFANDFETRTQGVDLVVTYRPAAARGDTAIDLALNLTSNDVVAHNPLTLDDQRVRELQEALPEVRFNLTVHHEIGRAELLGRLGYFDGWWDPWDDRTYRGAFLLDLEAAIRLDDSTRLVLGGRNVLGEYGEPSPYANLLGNRYSSRSPFDTNGSFLYARLQYRWGGGN